MNQDEFEHLADSAFDGRDDAPVRERIEVLAAGDAELRERWENLEAARAGLGGAGLETLPPGLHAALIGVARSTAHPRGERMSWLSFVTAAIQSRPVFALGGAVAAGLAIGVFGVGLISGGLRAGQDLAPATTASLPPIAAAMVTTTLDLRDAHVGLSSRRADGEVVIRLDARDGTPGTVTLTWDPRALRLSGLRWPGFEAPPFESTSGRLGLRIPSASGSELSFEELVTDGGAVRATLSAAGGNREVTLQLPR